MPHSNTHSTQHKAHSTQHTAHITQHVREVGVDAVLAAARIFFNIVAARKLLGPLEDAPRGSRHCHARTVIWAWRAGGLLDWVAEEATPATRNRRRAQYNNDTTTPHQPKKRRASSMHRASHGACQAGSGLARGWWIQGGGAMGFTMGFTRAVRGRYEGGTERAVRGGTRMVRGWYEGGTRGGTHKLWRCRGLSRSRIVSSWLCSLKT